MDNTKLTRSAAVIDRILKILQGFALAGVIVAAIFIPLTAILGEKIIASADTLTLGVITFHLIGGPESYLVPTIKISIIIMLVCIVLEAAAAWYFLKVLRDILAPMKEGKPFASGNSGKIRKLGWTALIAGGVTELGRVVSDISNVRAYQIERLFNPETVSSFSYNYRIDRLLPFLHFPLRRGAAAGSRRDAVRCGHGKDHSAARPRHGGSQDQP